MRLGEPLPKGWVYATVAIAAVVAMALPSNSVLDGMVALVVVLAIAFTARLLYSRTRK